MRSIDNKFYRSKAWKECRKAYISKCGGLCELCLKKGQIVPGYIVHHKTHLTEDNYNDPSVSLNFDNLMYVCFNCHQALHFKKTSDRYVIDDNGNVIITET